MYTSPVNEADWLRASQQTLPVSSFSEFSCNWLSGEASTWPCASTYPEIEGPWNKYCSSSSRETTTLRPAWTECYHLWRKLACGRRWQRPRPDQPQPRPAAEDNQVSHGGDTWKQPERKILPRTPRTQTTNVRKWKAFHLSEDAFNCLSCIS